jgi:hypothetical protein
MGREIRMVPPNWQHPTKMVIRWKDGRLQHVEEKQSMYDRRYDDAIEEWVKGREEWKTNPQHDCTWEEWSGNAPDPEYYRPWKDQEATWFQLWQTVSEGSPVSPPFETREELAQYLAENGDEWDQLRRHGGWGVEAAKRFCSQGWAPSFIADSAGIVEGKLFDAAGKDAPNAQ